MKARAEASHVEDTWCSEGINRTPQSNGGGAWLAGIASRAMLVGLVFAWLSLLGRVTAVASPTLPNWTVVHL